MTIDGFNLEEERQGSEPTPATSQSSPPETVYISSMAPWKPGDPIVSLENVPDFMNEYGDQVAAEVMANFPDLHAKLDFPLAGGEELNPADAIRKVTGRIPLLPLADQEKLYDLIEREYRELVERQEALGESILEAQTFDLDACTMARMEVIGADFGIDSPFTNAVYLEVVDAKIPRKPLTTLQAVNSIRNNLGLSEVKESDEHDFEEAEETAQQIVAERIAQLEKQLVEYRDRSFSRLKNPDAIVKFDERLEKQQNRIQDILEEYALGAPVRLITPNNNVFYGVVAKTWQAGGQENPVAPSGWRMQVLLADPARELIVPFSRINTDKDNAIRMTVQERDWEGNDVYESFDLKQVQEREQRQIFTGNLLRAFEQFSEGKLINFTDHRGSIRQGIITPKEFEIEQVLQQQPVFMPTVSDAYRFLYEVTNRTGQLKTADELLIVKCYKQGDSLLLLAPRAKDAGGRYYLDSDLLAAAGNEFYSTGDRMECIVESDKIESVLETIMQRKHWQLAAFEGQSLALEMLDISLPTLEPFSSDILEASVETRSDLEGLKESHLPEQSDSVASESVSVKEQQEAERQQSSETEVTALASNKLESLKDELVKTWQPSLFHTEPYVASPQSQGVKNSSAWDVVDDEELTDLREGQIETVSLSSDAISSPSENQNSSALPSITTNEEKDNTKNSNVFEDSLDLKESKTPSLHDLRDWYRVAGALGKSQEYRDRIVDGQWQR